MGPSPGQPLARRLRHAALDRLAALTRHPLISVLVGVGLLLSGLAELLDELVVDFESALKTHHGLILLGGVTVLRGFAELVEGVVWLGRDAEAAETAEQHRGEVAR